MSFTAIQTAFSHIKSENLRPATSLVLLCLANRHNQETGRCDPSNLRITEDTGLSERTVRSAIRSLEAKRLITTVCRVQSTGNGRRNLTNRYRMNGVVRGGAKSAGGMGQNLPPKQEDRQLQNPTAFDDIIFLLDEGADFEDPSQNLKSDLDGEWHD